MVRVKVNLHAILMDHCSITRVPVWGKVYNEENWRKLKISILSDTNEHWNIWSQSHSTTGMGKCCANMLRPLYIAMAVTSIEPQLVTAERPQLKSPNVSCTRMHSVSAQQSCLHAGMRYTLYSKTNERNPVPLPLPEPKRKLRENNCGSFEKFVQCFNKKEPREGTEK